MSQREIDRLQAMQRFEANLLTQPEIAQQLGISLRQVKRLWRAYCEQGAVGLVSKKRGRPGNRRKDPALMQRALELVAQCYPDFGPTLAAEKLAERDGIVLPRETLRTAMIAAGLWTSRRAKRKPAHVPRERRPCFGELIQIDGSQHRWFEERGPKCTLLVFIDDATSRLMALRFVPVETTQNYFEVVDEYIRSFGRPMAFYSDRFGVFRVNVRSEKTDAITQFGRAMRELEIQSICASSPQAKGRVERANGVLQNRLVKELRLQQISTLEQANAFAPTYLADHNHRFAVAPRSDINVHRPLGTGMDLNRILCLAQPRIVSANLTVQYGARIFELIEPTITRRLRHSQVLVREHRNGTIVIERAGQPLNYRLVGPAKAARIVEAKAIETTELRVDRYVPNPRKAHPLSANHPWRFKRRSSNPSGDFSIGPDGDIIPLR